MRTLRFLFSAVCQSGRINKLNASNKSPSATFYPPSHSDSMEYRPQIIASDLDGLQVVSACSTGAKVRVADIKFLLSNKVFLLSIERTKIETDQEDKHINSILRFDNVLKVKSKNINQNNKDLVIELMAIDYLKNNNDYEINLMFENNVHISLVVEALEILLEDQNEINE